MKLLGIVVLVLVVGVLAVRGFVAEGQKAMTPGTVSMVKPNWKELKRADYGFKINHPQDWLVEYANQGVELLPKDNPKVFDADLKREVASPGVNIKLVDLPDENADAVTQFIQFRPDGYNGYKQIKKYPCTIPNSTHATAYEFQYDAGTIRFIALSLIVQKGTRMFNVTASGRSEDFEKFRSDLTDIVFSFGVLK